MFRRRLACLCVGLGIGFNPYPSYRVEVASIPSATQLRRRMTASVECKAHRAFDCCRGPLEATMGSGGVSPIGASVCSHGDPTAWNPSLFWMVREALRVANP